MENNIEPDQETAIYLDVDIDVDKDNIYFGTLYPKGEPNDKLTSYLTEYQLEQSEEKLKGKPIHIEHILKNDKNEDVAPSGIILHSKVHPEKKRLDIAFYLFDNDNGVLAKQLIHEGHMMELSLGNEYQTIKEGDGPNIPVSNIITEASIVFEGAREDTKIRKIVPIKNLINMAKDKQEEEKKDMYNNISNMNKFLNKLKTYELKNNDVQQ